MATHSVRPAFRNNSEALARVTTGQSMSNYPTIYAGFIKKGIQSPRLSRERTSSHTMLGARWAAKCVAANTASKS